MDFESFTLLAATDDLGVEPAARVDADGLELRMDFADEPLAQLDAYDGDLPILVTNRPTWEGGEAADTAGRLDALETALEHDAVTAVDLELAALEGAGDHDAGRVADAARDRGASVVVSTHNFESTPDREAIVSRLERACAHGDVGKMAGTAQSPDDVLAMLGATRELTAEGEQVERVHGCVWPPLQGCRPVTVPAYAPVDPADATAPGRTTSRRSGHWSTAQSDA